MAGIKDPEVFEAVTLLSEVALSAPQFYQPAALLQLRRAAQLRFAIATANHGIG